VGGSCECDTKSSGYIKEEIIYWPAEQVLASPTGFC
jgi:hypothetical protein